MAGHGTVTTLGKSYTPLINVDDAGYQHEPAFDSGYLQVDDVHSLYYEQYGKPDGKPGSFFRCV
jgi:hypothetical protein